ncbi:ABC transporter substrate-binding protein [Thermophilibacter immobilis]|jgi:peptide/nickel transport system substrate-binding protein|uniref:ABC transporter substrate-binding protein n=1 Tax=Thermophilibacter immobilis TaxID=2779519 RepID=A0A7S7M927_9ACTN|nr:ABC transporter substrate-binding protein [Thermophilibacter immobilis]QOY60980.1 ABC transporter substrate-binding protein [Thermophilibacter immobilis]
MNNQNEDEVGALIEQGCLSRRNFLRTAGLFGLGAAAVGLAGCSSDDGTTSDAATSGEQASGGTLVISLPSSPKYLDPILYTGTYESQIINSVCDTLVEYKTDLSEISTSLATEWTISDDGLTYTFTIRDDAKFQPGEYQDGRVVTANDVKYSLERSANESSMNRLSMLDHCNVVSDTQVECVLTSPAASFLTALTDAGNVIVPQEEVEGWGDSFGDHLVGSGPFALEQFAKDQQSDLTRHDGYWGPTPYLDGVTVKVVTDMNQAANALATGEVDMATSLTGEAVQTVKNNTDLTLNQTPGLHVAYVYMNQVNGPTADQRVRKAIIMAVNREDLTKGVYPYGEAVEASLPLPTGSWGYDSSLEADVPSYDPEGAKQLLEEAGYGDGLSLNLYISNTEARLKMATILQQSLKENLGIDLTINPADWGTFSAVAAAGQADLYGMSWTWYPDPYFFLNKLFSSSEVGALGNGAGFSHEEVDDLLAKALEVTDQGARADYYKQALKAIVSYDPMLVYASENVNTGMTGSVQGYVQRSDGKVLITNQQVNISKS